jgi:hypothetical protein
MIVVTLFSWRRAAALGLIGVEGASLRQRKMGRTVETDV